MTTVDRLLRVLEVVQRCIDTAIPVGCLIPHTLLVFSIVEIPPSIADVLIAPSVVWLWSLLSFIGYTAVVLGTWLKPSQHPKLLKARWLQRFYLTFLFPGLITSSIFTLVYAGAILVSNGLFSPSFTAICFIGAVGIYFFLRFLRLYISIKTQTAEVPATAGR